MKQGAKRRTQEERNAIAREKLCQAALELFAIKGYDSTSLADIGVRAGYSRGLAQYHFQTKTNLAVILLDAMAERDLQSQELVIPADADGATAWGLLEKHTQASWTNFRAMLDGTDKNLAERGEMILCVTAIFSQDAVLREKIAKLSRQLTADVARVLRVCQRDGFLRDDFDPIVMAGFYSTAIWGIVNAHFSDPNNLDYTEGLVRTLRDFMNSLRTDR